MEDVVKGSLKLMYERMNFGNTINEILNNETYGGIIAGYADKFRQGLEVIGLSLCILFFLIALVELAQNDSFTLETFIKFFVKLAIGVFLVTNSQWICQACEGIGQEISIKLTTGVSGGLTENDINNFVNTEYAKTYEELNTLEKLGELVMNGLIFMVASAVLTTVAQMICFTRFFELAIRSTLMPIALAMATDDGWRGAAGRYIKKYLAVCCQGAVLVIIAGVYTSMLATASSGMIMMVGCGIAAVSIMFKSIGYINDAFGV